MAGDLWTRGGLTWKELGKRLWRQVYEDELLGRSAELGFFFFFSVFPLLLFLTTLLGYLAASGDLRRELFDFVGTISPSTDITALLQTTLEDIVEKRSRGKLGFGLGVALWVASNGVLAIGRTLNTACGLREKRPWWKRRLVSVALTVVVAVLTATALGLVLAGGIVVGRLTEGAYGATHAALTVGWHLVQWPLVLLFVAVAFELIYNYAPAMPREARAWVTPGTVVALVVWLLASLAFRFYIASFGHYDATYGSLGVIIILLAWFYLTGLAILVGGEINSEIARGIEETGGSEPRRCKLEKKAAKRAEREPREGGDPEDEAR